MKRGLSRWAREDRRLLPHVIRLHAESGSIYGVRRLREMLRRERPYVSTRRLSRLMSFAGLRGACCTRRMRTTRSDGSVVASDQVKRQFKAERPNELWVGDSTYIPTKEGTLSLAVIQDVYSRCIVGWGTSSRQRSELMVGALRRAIHHRRPQEPVVHHSDRGSQYTSEHFRSFCRAFNVKVSVGSVGDCYDNAMAESFFASLEKELIHQQPQRRFVNRDEAKKKIFEYLEGCYNTRRLHSALRYRSPLEFEHQNRQSSEIQS